MNELAKGILNGIYSFVGNYGWSVMLFTLLIRLILFPFDYKSRVSMRKTQLIQPQLTELQKKYANDKEKLNRKMTELYQKEHISPLSGCLPLLLSWPIILWMWSAMRTIANEQLVQQVITLLTNPDSVPQFESWLWLRNVWMPDSPFSSALPDLNALRAIPTDVWTQLMTSDVIATLPGELSQLTAESFASANLATTLQQIYSTLAASPVYLEHAGAMAGWTFNFLGLFSFSLMKEYNGFFILPILSAVSQVAMTAMTPQQSTTGADGQKSTMNFMKWFMPLFSLWICSNYNGVFSLYWVTSNLIMMVQTYFINRYLDKKDQRAKEVAVEGNVR